MKGIYPRIRELADQFWNPIIKFRSFPVDIERAIARSNLPLHIDSIPGLDLVRIEQWIQEHNLPALLNKDNSELHGFLFAHKGNGVIFVNGSDSIEDRRFTIAHELAHFLIDYQVPRNLLLEHFGDSILEVLDGNRAATIEERLQFILSDLPSPFFTHILDHHGITAFERMSVWNAEWRTDVLAVEILAPFRIVSGWLKKPGEMGFESVFRKASAILATDFGLPPVISTGYARHIANSITGGKTLAEEWGIK